MTRLNITIACLAVIAALICSAYGGPPVRPKTKDSPVKARGTGTPPTTPSAKDEETYVLDKIFSDEKGALGLTREEAKELYSSEGPDTDLAFPDTLAKSGKKTCGQVSVRCHPPPWAQGRDVILSLGPPCMLACIHSNFHDATLSLWLIGSDLSLATTMRSFSASGTTIA